MLLAITRIPYTACTAEFELDGHSEMRWTFTSVDWSCLMVDDKFLHGDCLINGNFSRFICRISLGENFDDPKLVLLEQTNRSGQSRSKYSSFHCPVVDYSKTVKSELMEFGLARKTRVSSKQ